MKTRLLTVSRRTWALAAAGLAGTAFGTSCTTAEINAFLAGVQVVTDQLTEDDDISFGDWLSSELND